MRDALSVYYKMFTLFGESEQFSAGGNQFPTVTKPEVYL